MNTLLRQSSNKASSSGDVVGAKDGIAWRVSQYFIPYCMYLELTF